MTYKIMLIDDISISNFIMEKTIKLVTKEAEIYQFTDPELAYRSLSTISPDLMFLDLNMPVIDGWEFLEKMQQDQLEYKVVVLTSSISMLDKENAVKFENVIDYSEKPLNKNKIPTYLANLPKTA